MGTHWEGFSINPREGFLLRSNIFPDQMRPLASPSRGRNPKRWAIARPRIVGYRGSAHPPEGNPPRKDPERQCAGGCRAAGQPAAQSPCRPYRGGASVARWRPRPFARHPHDSGDRLARLPSLQPHGSAAPPAFRHRAARPSIWRGATRLYRSAPTDSSPCGPPMPPARFTTSCRFPAIMLQGVNSCTTRLAFPRLTSAPSIP